MSSDEDYMSDKYTMEFVLDDVRPGLVLSHSKQREIQLEKKKRKIEEEQRQAAGPSARKRLYEGLSNPLSSDNKGFSLLAKMGYKEGQPIGKSSTGILEPIPLSVKLDRAGLGTENSRAEQLKNREEMKHQALLKMETSSANIFRVRLIREGERRYYENALKECQLSCQQLDESVGIFKPMKRWYWPSVIEANDQNNEESESDEEEIVAKGNVEKANTRRRDEEDEINKDSIKDEEDEINKDSKKDEEEKNNTKELGEGSEVAVKINIKDEVQPGENKEEKQKGEKEDELNINTEDDEKVEEILKISGFDCLKKDVKMNENADEDGQQNKNREETGEYNEGFETSKHSKNDQQRNENNETTRIKVRGVADINNSIMQNNKPNQEYTDNKKVSKSVCEAYSNKEYEGADSKSSLSFESELSFESSIDIESETDSNSKIDLLIYPDSNREEDYTLITKVEILTAYLHNHHHYCYWCGVHYENIRDVMKHCPGSQKTDHDF